MSLTLDLVHLQQTGERKMICGWDAQRRNAAMQAQSDKSVTLNPDPIASLNRSHPNVHPNSIFANAYVAGWDKPEMATSTYWHRT